MTAPETTRPSTPVPWTFADARTMVLTTAGGIGILFGAWWGAGGVDIPNSQTPWLAVGIAAIVLMATGNLFWLLSGRRAVQLRKQELLARLDVVLDAFDGAAPASPRAADARVVVPGSPRYHRPDCLLAKGKAVRPVPAKGRRKKLEPCEMCNPDDVHEASESV